MSRSEPTVSAMAVAVTDNSGAEVSIPSTTSDEMSTDANRRDLALTTGDHRAMQTPMNIMSLNTTIVPPNQGNLEPQSELFNQMWAKISNTIMLQVQDAKASVADLSTISSSSTSSFTAEFGDCSPE